jgi:hypothetical protein
MTTTNLNTNENVKLVNNTTFDPRTISGAHDAFMDMVENNSPMPEAFEDLFTIEIFTRPSGSKYGVLNFA